MKTIVYVTFALVFLVLVLAFFIRCAYQSEKFFIVKIMRDSKIYYLIRVRCLGSWESMDNLDIHYRSIRQAQRAIDAYKNPKVEKESEVVEWVSTR